jgi:hypothetical protein
MVEKKNEVFFSKHNKGSFIQLQKNGHDKHDHFSR